VDAPVLLPAAREAELDRDVAEVRAAIEMVAGGVARRMIVVGLHRPGEAADLTIEIARSAGVRVTRGGKVGLATIVVEPLRT
jgi:hypothetical protein